jgi:hypothetical protein
MEENSIQVSLSQMEVDFVVKILTQLSINPASQDAVNVVAMVHSVLGKLAKTKE